MDFCRTKLDSSKGFWMCGLEAGSAPVSGYVQNEAKLA